MWEKNSSLRCIFAERKKPGRIKNKATKKTEENGPPFPCTWISSLQKYFIMRINYPVIASALSLVLFVSCSKEGIRGSGITRTETRNPEPFTRIHTNGNIDVQVRQGNLQKVTVRGYENLLSITETKVTGNVLNIQFLHHYNVRNSNVEVFIEIAALQETNINGDADIRIDGFTGGSNFFAHVNGSGNTYISNCSYTNAELNVNGSGNINAHGLSCQAADLSITGSGDIELSCQQFLNARISGSGDIRYWGQPSLNVNISGSGTVKRQ
jgi:hypothetical protein